MKKIGNEIYVQRGENWSLDFNITNSKGDPYMLLKEWNNPYLAITVTAARYEQEGDFRQTYWLDLNNRWVEKNDGTTVLEPIKKFMSTEALPLPFFSVDEAIRYYGEDAGGRIVIDKNSDFDITNFLFYTDPQSDGNRVYRYVKDYVYTDMVFQLRPQYYGPGTETFESTFIVEYLNTLYFVKENTTAEDIPGLSDKYVPLKLLAPDNLVYLEKTADTVPVRGGIYYAPVPLTNRYELWVYVDDYVKVRDYTYDRLENGGIISEDWEDYDFRVIKQFNTKEWTEQGYLFDIKILAGMSVEEYVYNVLSADGDDVPDLPWDNATLQKQINLVSDEATREELQIIYDEGLPLMPDYDTKTLILEPTKLFVSANIQGRY